LPHDDETERAKAMVGRYVEGFHAADIDRIGIRGLIAANDAADEIDGDKAFRLERGYHSLMQALRGANPQTRLHGFSVISGGFAGRMGLKPWLIPHAPHARLPPMRSGSSQGRLGRALPQVPRARLSGDGRW
jgi:hypothetical protein